MENIIIQKAIEIIEKYHSRETAPKMALFGPPESGKTAFLTKLRSFCDQTPDYPIITFNIDLRYAPISSHNALYKYIYDEILSEAKRKNITPDTSGFTGKYDLDFDHLIKELLRCTDSYVMLFIDHIDMISFERAMGLVHRFHYYSDEAAEDSKNYKNLGLCIAGIKSLFELRHSLHSVFVSYDIIRFPRQARSIKRAMVEERVKSNGAGQKAFEQYVEKLTDMTGGESAFLQPLLDNLNGKVSGKYIEAAQAELYKQDTPVFRHLALRIWSDPALQQMVRDLLQNKPVAQRRGNNPEIDENQLSGAVVLAPRNDSEPDKMFYRFRNDLVKDFLSRFIKNLDETSGKGSDLAVSAEIANLNELKEKCEKANNLTEFFRNLELAWKEITDFSVDPAKLSIKCYIAKTESSSGRPISIVRRISTKPVLAVERLEISNVQIRNILEDWILNLDTWYQKSHTYFYWTEEVVTFCYALKGFDNYLVVLSISLPTTEINDEFTEFTLSHWVRFIDNNSIKIIELILVEFGRLALKKGLISEESVQIAGFFSAMGTEEKYYQNVLYWPKEREKFLASRSNLTALTGFLPEDQIAKFNEEYKKICDGGLTSSDVKEKLQKITRSFYFELKNIFGNNIDELFNIAEKDALYIESDRDGLRIPFELLHLPDKGHDLLSTRIPVVRRLRLDTPRILSSPFHIEFAKLQLTGKPFRVLIISGDDKGGKLDEVKNEAAAIKARLNGPKVEVVVAEDESIEQIEERMKPERLKDEPFHLLHFTGHAKYTPNEEHLTGLGIRSEDDGKNIVSYGRFAQAIKNANLWLVYLSCCHGAVTDLPGLGQTYLNCMEALVKVGIPNIIGFRWAIEDFRAKRFAMDFYAKLFIDNGRVRELGHAMLETRRNSWNAATYPDVVASSILISLAD